ncbi:MAG: hypothetical protein GVY10_03165 [Verrucomicrobia bacterium]|jgi:type VI secretion system secreted protein Hcp|nr:hypothetical protein [Verrucomicrobiota bacterium]
MLSGILLPLLLCSGLRGEIYLQLDGVEGGSTDAGYVGQIDVSSYGTGLVRPTDRTSPSGSLRVSKELDKATPLLFSRAATGSAIPTGTLTRVVVSGPDGTFHHMELEGILVTSVETREGIGGGHGGETVGLDASRVQWTYRHRGGVKETEVEVFWDFATNTGGNTATAAPKLGQPADQSLSAGDSAQLPLSISDADTAVDTLSVTAHSSNPDLVAHPNVAWDGTAWNLHLAASPVGEGNAVISVIVDDGVNSTAKNFIAYVDSSGTPYGGFERAYFSETERADPLISSPVADPDNDRIPTVVEFLLGSNPREFTPLPEVLTMERVSDGNGGSALVLRFDRRTDEPGIRLALLRSDDGAGWDPSDPGPADPVYSEFATPTKNPLYEKVEATVIVPDTGEWRFLFRLSGTF